MASNLIIIACSIFRNELEHLKATGKINVPVVYLNSMLHMYPRELQTLLDQKIKEYADWKVILVYGDCHARMYDYEQHSNIVRTPGINCCEIFLGNKHYRQLRSEGAFIILPEWASRWEEVFKDYMGFKTTQQIRPFMSEMHNKLTFVDTGYSASLGTLLDDIADFTGLPLEILPSSIDELEKVLLQLVKQQSDE